eukprot:338484-Pleurochrysis_carterae.AAC.1
MPLSVSESGGGGGGGGGAAGGCSCAIGSSIALAAGPNPLDSLERGLLHEAEGARGVVWQHAAQAEHRGGDGPVAIVVEADCA